MATMEKELKSMILDGPDSPEAEEDEVYSPVDQEECLENLVRLTGKSREQLLELINSNKDEEDPYED